MKIILTIAHKGTRNPVIEVNWTAVPRQGEKVMYCTRLYEVWDVEWHVCADWEDPDADPETFIPYALVVLMDPE